MSGLDILCNDRNSELCISTRKIHHTEEYLLSKYLNQVMKWKFWILKKNFMHFLVHLTQIFDKNILIDRMILILTGIRNYYVKATVFSNITWKHVVVDLNDVKFSVSFKCWQKQTACLLSSLVIQEN